jgi:hypothetical protein
MNDLLFFVSLIAGWIVLNLWILPLFGIQTCMSGACRVPNVVPPRGTENKSIHESQPVRDGERS